MTTGTIGNDVQDELNAGASDDVDDVDSAAEFFLKKWKVDQSDDKTASTDTKDEKEAQPDPKETEEQEDAENTANEDEHEDEADHEDEETSGDGDETGGEGTDEQKVDAEKKLASDDHEVEITVDGETRRVAVKDLKRLFGQEASLTRKSQEVAEQRKATENQSKVYATGLQKMLERAQKRWEPFSKVDFLVASKTMDDESFANLRAAAQSAFEDVKFYQEELNGHVQAQEQAELKSRKEQAVECVKALENPDTGIKGWNQKMYEDLRGFAAEQGLLPEHYNRLLDPGAFRLIHMAYQFAQAQKVGVKKVVKAPKNIGKTKNSQTATNVKTVNQRKAMDKLRASGDVEDAAAAFMSRWNNPDDRD